MLREGIKGGIQKFLIFNCLLFASVGGCAGDGDRHTEKKVELTVSAAASMENVLQDIGVLYNQKYPEAKITFYFGSSGSLQHQIEQGAPVDIFISAAPQQMDNLAKKDLLLSETRQDLVKNQMVLIAPKNNRAIDNFNDLGKKSIQQVALGEPSSVPAGQYAREILTNLEIADVVSSKAVYGKNVRQVLSYVATGNTDAGIVYRTDTLNNDRVEVVDIAPEKSYSPVVYPIAIVKDSHNTKAARQMLQFLFTAEAQNIFKRYGFIPVSDR